MRRMSLIGMILLVTGLQGYVFSETLTLENVIREVCTKSDSVQMMKETITKSDEMVREQWANAFPTISATGTVAHSYGSLLSGSSSSSTSSRSSSVSGSLQNGADKQSSVAKDVAAPITITDQNLPKYLGEDLSGMFSSFSQPQNTDIYSTSLTMSQTLYSFGKVSTGIDVAKAFNHSAKCTYERNMQTLQLGALDAFCRVVLSQKSVEIAERSLNRKQELNSYLDRNFQMGSGSRAQVLKTKADVISQATDILIAKRDAKSIRMQFNAFIGRQLLDATEFDTISMLSEIVSMKIPDAATAVKTALEERKDLQSLKYLAESNKGGAKIYDAMYLPSIGASGSVGYSKMQSGSSILSNNGNANWSVGVGAQWTLFDGFANSAKASQYKSDARKLEIVHNTMAKMLEIEIRTAIEECAAADSNFIASKEMYNSAKESYELTENNFKQGSGQFADLQLSDELLQQSELGLISAKNRLIRSRAALVVAMGKDIVAITDKDNK